MATRFQVKRSSVSGVKPTTSDIQPGELAVNLADRKMFTSNGSAIFEVGSNLANLSVSGNLQVNAIIANGSVGTNRQTLYSNGSSVYWAAGGNSSITVSNTAPASPANNDLWWDSSQGTLFIRYGDEDGGQWVESHQSGIVYTAAASPQVYIQNTQPVVSVGNKYMWVQTGLGDGGGDFTIWIEDGT